MQSINMHLSHYSIDPQSSTLELSVGSAINNKQYKDNEDDEDDEDPPGQRRLISFSSLSGQLSPI